MEEDDKGCPMIRLGVSGRVFLLVPAYPGCPGQKPLNGCVCVCIGSVYHLTDLHEYYGKMIFCTGNVTHEL